MTDQHQNHLDQAESLAGEYAHNGHRSRHRVSHHTRKRVILLGMLWQVEGEECLINSGPGR